MPASGYVFFLSHSSRDRDKAKTIEKFTLRLAERISQMDGIPLDEVGFIDQSDIALGDAWSPRLTEALQTCRAMVPLYSPWYFKSPYCGKELALFQDRVQQYVLDNRLPRPPALIFPVLLEQVSIVPDVVSDIQYDNAKYPPKYRDLRLRAMMQNNASLDHYKSFVELLARDILQATKTHALPPLTSRPRVADIPSLFTPGDATSAPSGPRNARFFFVAGTRDELQALRRKVDAYGRLDNLEWQPYFPQLKRNAVALAQEVAADLDMASFPERVDVAIADRFLDQLHDARVKKQLAIVFVDTWTLGLRDYQTLMKLYDSADKSQLPNTAVVVMWNKGDQETVDAWPILRGHVNAAFPTREQYEDPYVYREIGSLVDFGQSLRDLLARVQLKAIDNTQVVARAEAERFIPQPLITGPAAR